MAEEHECSMNSNLPCDTMAWRMTELEKRVSAIETKIWAIIILLIGNLGGIIGILIKGIR